MYYHNDYSFFYVLLTNHCYWCTKSHFIVKYNNTSFHLRYWWLDCISLSFTFNKIFTENTKQMNFHSHFPLPQGRNNKWLIGVKKQWVGNSTADLLSQPNKTKAATSFEIILSSFSDILSYFLQEWEYDVLE